MRRRRERDGAGSGAVKVVVALGGNALLRRGEPAEADRQRHNVAIAAEAVAQLAREHTVVVTHGNGPQVGLLALQSAADRTVGPYPLDVLDAETEGMIGYVLEQELGNRLPGRSCATLLTQVVVDAHDPAFAEPEKPIGPVYDEDQARVVRRERGWTLARDGGHWRRVVASPAPRQIVELPAIRVLVEAGVLVICAGGGGIPVVADDHGSLHGVEAVVDKDRSAALLARALGADALLMLTDVEGVFVDWGSPGARMIRAADPGSLRSRTFPAGSMGPKVQAAIEFVEAGGTLAAIGALEDAVLVLRGERGTQVRAGADGLEIGKR